MIGLPMRMPWLNIMVFRRLYLIGLESLSMPPSLRLNVQLRHRRLLSILRQFGHSTSKRDANRIRQLTAQVSALQEDIKSAQIEKKQIKKIAAPFLSAGQVTDMLVEKGFYDRRYNPDGTGITHQYEARTINGDKIVVDEANGLTWQQGGSDQLPFEGAQTYIKGVNGQ